jgi:hypothetical protein
MNMDSLIKKVKSGLGAPILDVEITDEMFSDLLSDAYSCFYLFSELSKEYSKERLAQIERFWVERYFTALSKECLGNIRGKFSGDIRIPGSDVKLDYKYLIKQAEAEKAALIRILYPEYKYENEEEFVLLALYVNVGSMSLEDSDRFSKKISQDLNFPDFIKSIIIPIREGESRVELVYSNTKRVDATKIYDIYNQFKDLDSEIEKYLPKEDEK